jgi:hypothetical protein
MSCNYTSYCMNVVKWRGSRAVGAADNCARTREGRSVSPTCMSSGTTREVRFLEEMSHFRFDH